MSTLSPRLFDRRYDDLVELGRSRLPSLAPEWTDHNAHDPGITLMELLAWVAEAQLYSVGHLRRDERTAYAALLGVAAAGTRAARGLLWTDRSDPASPSSTFAGSVLIEPDTTVRLRDDDKLVFRPEHRILWTPGRIVRLASGFADGTGRDYTSTNERGGAVFLPFGETAGPRDVLTLEFETRADEGLFPPMPDDASGAFWVIGVRAANSNSAESADPFEGNGNGGLVATLIAGASRFPLPIVADTSAAMMRTGALVLDLSLVKGSPKRFAVEFRAPRGLPRAPRVLRIEPNVLPIVQRRTIVSEVHAADGLPDQSFDLDVPRLCFEPGEQPVRVLVRDGKMLEQWLQCERLSDQGPGDSVFELDEAAARLYFGNGHNGRRPPEGAQVLVSYPVSDGASGNFARNRKWIVGGIAGEFGTNPDPVDGGADRFGSTELRHEARHRKVDDHALVSATDIEDAAKSLSLLEVARAWVRAPQQAAPDTGAVTLIAMRRRQGGLEPAQPPETRRWLEAIRRRLAGRIPLGTRLAVVAPRYVDFTVRAQLRVERGRDPIKVEAGVREVLRNKLALVAADTATTPREPGVPVTTRDVAAWIRSVDGVGDVLKVDLVTRQGVVSEVAVRRDGLPRLDLDHSEIQVARTAPGTAT